MKKIKININRAPVSKEEIESKRNFEQVLQQAMAYSKPFYQTKLFLNGILFVLFVATIMYTVSQLEKKEQETKEQENDGYVQNSTVKEISSIDSLKTQEFVVQIDKDTLLNTAEGAIIKIAAGSLESTSKNVVLVVKEAYTLEDMIRAGLTTKSGNDLLSSGGMFYIQAKDSANVKITKSLSIAVPTDEVNSDMKLFSGQTTPLGKIDWQDPVALKKDTTQIVSEGETLFKENCKSCHTLGKESVGPDLAYIGKRRDFDFIKRYVKNSSLMISTNREIYIRETDTISDTGEIPVDGYAYCLYQKYNKAEMTAFPMLNDKDIKALCDYFNDESKRLKLPYPKDELYINFQKCKTYKALMSELYNQKYKLTSKRSDKIIDNGPFVKQVDRSMQVLQMPNNAAIIQKDDRKSYIYPATKQSEYYQVEINTFGWYNIDRLTKNIPGLVASNLVVNVPAAFIHTFQIYLVLPDMKVHAIGGLLQGRTDAYGFYEDNGNIMLPQGKTGHIYLAGEKDGQLLYAAVTFVTDKTNKLSLSPVVISKETFNTKIKELIHSEGIEIKATDSKNATAIRKIDTDLNALEEKIKNAEKMAPKDCDCGCRKEFIDSTIVIMAN